MANDPAEVTVRKLNPQQVETWRYSGRILEDQSNYIVLIANFNRPDTPFHGILLRDGDPFIETYYTDRWYNIFEMHDWESGEVKGWYCNVTLPAERRGRELSYVDLALDLLVYPDGRQIVLDEDEFSALHLSQEVQAGALQALAELQALFYKKFNTKRPGSS